MGAAGPRLGLERLRPETCVLGARCGLLSRRERGGDTREEGGRLARPWSPLCRRNQGPDAGHRVDTRGFVGVTLGVDTQGVLPGDRMA